MKKKITIILFFIIIFFIYYIYEMVFLSPILTIDKLRITNAVINQDSLGGISEEYGVSEDDLQKIEQYKSQLKYVIVTGKCENKSVFKRIEEAKFKFENNEKLPDIILGAHPEAGLLTPVNIKPNQTNQFGLTILIDPKGYSDEEIIAILEKVKITMISKNNENIKVESNPVSLVVGASS